MKITEPLKKLFSLILYNKSLIDKFTFFDASAKRINLSQNS